MKLSTSSYHASTSTSSSSSSSTITMHNSKSTTNAGCLISIFRKILCSRGVPTQSSDQTRELRASNSMGSGKAQDLNAEAGAASTTTPGIVARLMGLESIASSEMPCSSKPGSLSRSRSMNSMDQDYLGDCNGMQGLQKKVKSTLSFREVPTFLLIENEKFLVFSFENGGESRAFKSTGRKNEIGYPELKQKVPTKRGELKENKREKVCDKKKGQMSRRVCDVSCGNVRNDGKLQDITNTLHVSKDSSENKCFDSEALKLSQSQHLINCKEVVIGGKKKRKKKKTNCQTENKIEVECKSQDSSPVSVLDFEREACGKVGLNSRRKLSAELENDQNFHLRSDDNLVIDERKVKATENTKFGGPKEYTGIRGEICRLVEDDLARSNQIHGWMNEQCELESLSAEFESEIFDQLLNELMVELVGHSHSQVCNFKIL